MNAAYGEIKGRTSDYLLRVGRQSSTGGGVLGRFDGLAGSYGDAQDLRVNAVWRDRWWIIRKAPNRGSLAPAWTGERSRSMASIRRWKVYRIAGQWVPNSAISTTRRMPIGLLDYDTYFKAVNAAQFMGMSKGMSGLPENATLSFMLDHRKTPSLSIRNALNGATTSSVNDLLQTMSASSLRDLALARTATSNMGQVGITVPVREKWQVGGDFRLTNTTGLPASGQT